MNRETAHMNNRFHALNEQERATIIAALYYWQREGLLSGGHERELATNGGEFDDMTHGEINSLCARLDEEARG